MHCKWKQDTFEDSHQGGSICLTKSVANHTMNECVVCFESNVLFPILSCCARAGEGGSGIKRICAPCRSKIIKGMNHFVLPPWARYWEGLGEPKCPLCRKNLVTTSRHKQFAQCGQMWLAPIADIDEWVTKQKAIVTKAPRQIDNACCTLIDHPAWKKQRRY